MHLIRFIISSSCATDGESIYTYNYVASSIINRDTFSQIASLFALFPNTSETHWKRYTSVKSYLIRIHLIFHCAELAGSISRRQICYASLSANDGGIAAIRIYVCGVHEKNIPPTQWLLDGKAIGAIPFRLRSQLLRVFPFSRSPSPTPSKESTVSPPRPTLRRVIAIYGRRTLSRNYTAFNLSALFPSLPIRLALSRRQSASARE